MLRIIDTFLSSIFYKGTALASGVVADISIMATVQSHFNHNGDIKFNNIGNVDPVSLKPKIRLAYRAAHRALV